MSDSTQPAAELEEIVSLFYPHSEAQTKKSLGSFEVQSAQDCPREYRAMLAHEAHMTVTVEQRHECSVDVEVLESHKTDTHYLRKILLRRTSDRRVVQFGIVRLALNALQPIVRDEIMAQKIPLGRVLIQHNVLRHVQLNSLWKVACGEELANLFEVELGHITFGRTALIYCNGEPGVELLEIIAPEDTFE